MSKILEVTDENFDQYVINSDKERVLVDFWAPWCMPCKMQSDILVALEKELPENYHIVKINTDKNSEKAIQYSISSIPTLIIFEKGEIIERMIGVQKQDILFEKLVSKKKA